MTIRSNPPGALLYVDDYPIGETPVSTHFTYYGKRKFRLVKDGYETLTEIRSIPAPWYEFFPLDFVAENIVPGEIRDQRTLDFQLRPQTAVPAEQLIARAEELRRGVQATGGAAPPIGGLRGPSATGAAPLYPTPGPAETIPAPQGFGGQTVHPLPR